MLVDLHMHSTCSDGLYSPEWLVNTCYEKGIKKMALTDHDNLSGIQLAMDAAAALPEPIEVIRGVEISTELYNESIHILGYHIDPNNQKLNSKLMEMRRRRRMRVLKMVEKLTDMGYEIEINLLNPVKKTIGRPHIAKLLVAKGYFKNSLDCFEKLLKRGAPAYVPQPKLSPAEAISLIHGAGGIAVMAHPSEINDDTVPERLIQECNFDGMEIWHPSAKTPELIEKWYKLAKKYDLLTSGGSDFHGIKGSRYPDELGLWQVQYENVQEVINWKL